MAAKNNDRRFGVVPRQIRWQLVLAFVPLAVAAIAVVSVVSYRVASDSLRDQALRQLESVRDNKIREIERYFQGIEDQVITTARNPSTVAAVKQMAEATRELDTDPVTVGADGPALEPLKKYLETYYSTELGKDALKLTPLLPKGPTAAWLQEAYIANNPNAADKKQLLDRAHDATRYSMLHAAWHPFFRTMVEKFGFHDLYLLDATTGRILYSVAKYPDFQTSLLDGPYAASSFGNLFRRLQGESREGDYLLMDFAPYTPLHGKPAAFAGSPIFENGQKVGVLIVQVPIDGINAIMTADQQWETVGLGETGETYIIGRGATDAFMRTDSRFLEQLKATNPAVAQAGTTILALHIQSDAAVIGNDADEFHGAYIGYRGVPVLGAAGWLSHLRGLKWTIVTEMSEEEALRPVMRLRNWAIGLSTLSILGFVLVAWAFSHALSRPVRALAATMQEIQAGNYRARTEVKSRNELGLLAKGFNEMLDERVDSLVRVEQDNRQLQEEIRALLVVVAAAADGDFTQRAQVGSGALGNLADALNLMFENIGDLVHHLKDVSAGVIDSASQIRAHAEQLAEGSARQTGDITATTKAVQDMSSNIQSVSQTATAAAQTAKRAEEAAQLGGDVIRRVLGGMEALQRNTRTSALKIKRLGERSMEISTIIGTIQKISAQTNMLALNAEIEASRAGEHGLGFTVVADEVRKLAERTEQATEEIVRLIAAIQTETNDSVSGMERQAEHVEQQATLATEAGGALDLILRASAQSAGLISEISQAATEQVRGATSVSAAMLSISDVARQAQRSSEDTQRSTSALMDVAAQLNQQIGLFVVGGNGSGAPSPVAPAQVQATVATTSANPMPSAA